MKRQSASATKRDPLAGPSWTLPVAGTSIFLLWLLPFAWMISSSLKTLPEMLQAPLAPLPALPGFTAYEEVLRAIPVGRYFINTTLMALLIAGLQILLGLPAAYALAKLDFRRKQWVFLAIVATLLIPAQVRFVPVFVLFAELGWVNTMAALVLPFAVSAFGTFWFRQAMQNIPNQIIEAARLDGASEARIIYGIVGPIMLPTLAAFFIFSFVMHYNDYFWPLVMTTDDSVRTLPLGVALLREQGTGVRWNVIMAANTLLSVPPIVVFALAQKHLLRAATQR